MPIVAFRNIGEMKAGNTLSLVAVATNIAIQHNYKILVISTEFNDNVINKAFWKEQKKNSKLYDFLGNRKVITLGNGIEGLVKLLQSNKLTADGIKDYAKIVLKDRLEILPSCDVKKDYDDIQSNYLKIAKLACQVYDFVFVDVGNNLSSDVKSDLIKEAKVVINTTLQKPDTIEQYCEIKKGIASQEAYKNILLLSKYDVNSKYNVKNIIRLTKEKEIYVMPYNTLYFEAAEEAGIIDLFFRIGKKNATDENAFFKEQVDLLTNEIIRKLQETQI